MPEEPLQLEALILLLLMMMATILSPPQHPTLPFLAAKTVSELVAMGYFHCCIVLWQEGVMDHSEDATR